MTDLHCVLGPTLPPSDANHPLHCNRGLARDVEKKKTALIDFLVDMKLTAQRPTRSPRSAQTFSVWCLNDLKNSYPSISTGHEMLTSRQYTVQHKGSRPWLSKVFSKVSLLAMLATLR